MHRTERGWPQHGLALRLAVDHAVACRIKPFTQAIRWAIENWPDFLDQATGVIEERKRRIRRYRWWINLPLGQPPPDHAPLDQHFCWNQKVKRAERRWQKRLRRRRLRQRG